jgi:hypothetical protein
MRCPDGRIACAAAQQRIAGSAHSVDRAASKPHGIWRIKFAYDDFEPLSMDAQQASQLAISLHGIGEDELAGEIDEAVGRAAHYKTM